MDSDAGFYDPAEESGSTKERGGPIDYASLFAVISTKTGWTPTQISELTLKQLKHYINAWNKEVSGSKKSSEAASNPDIEDIRNFGLTAGIERIPRKKK